MKKRNHTSSSICVDRFEELLLDSDPLPFYALKLLLAMLEHNPTSMAHVERLHLVPVLFQVLLDHQNNATSTTMQQMAGVLHQLVAHKQSNMKELYENGKQNKYKNKQLSHRDRSLRSIFKHLVLIGQVWSITSATSSSKSAPSVLAVTSRQAQTPKRQVRCCCRCLTHCTPS